MLTVKDNKTPLIDRLIELGSDVCARNNVSVNFVIFFSFGISIKSNPQNDVDNHSRNDSMNHFQFS